jgi:hypothetical protein
MERQPVQSSNLLSVGYDKNTNILEIEFRSGSIYQYFNVPESMYVELLNAASKGTYFHNHIRGHYMYKRIK